MASRKSVGGGGPAKAAVQVFCRIRPTNKKELETGYTCVKYGEQNIEVKTEEGENKFNFDAIFGMDSTQEFVFANIAGPLITDVLSGYNATILAYGQSGTGKTHTMEGDLKSQENKGIIPRAVDALFEGVTEADENMEFTFKVSYVEIYLEKIRDLLDENRLKVNLTIREDKIKGIYIAGVTEEYVTSPQETLNVMNAGAANRAVAATGLNLGSSRSHSVFTITVGQKDVVTSATKSGKLVLVDLAGSEMVRKSNATGQQLEEAKMINKSLSALGQVINALTDEKLSHVPYRDSKLTRILQDSLGGNSKTALIVAVSPSSFNSAETVSTLRFGTRAKSIENKVTINQTRSVEELEALLVRAEKAIDAQTTHIITLSTQLQAAYAQLSAQGPAVVQDGAMEVSEASEGDASAQNGPGEGRVVMESEEARLLRLDREGKVVVDKLQREAEGVAFQRLQEQIAQLTSELDEERQESSRKSAELKQSTLLIKEKERLLAESAALLADAQHNVEQLRERSEAALNEKIEAVGALESLRSGVDEELGKAKFQIMELEVSLNTLQTENEQLKTEIAEMSGDAMTASPTKAGTSSKGRITNVQMATEEEPTPPPPPSNNVADAKSITNRRASLRGNGSNAELAGTAANIADDPDRVLSLAERKELFEEYSAQFANICMQYHLDETVSAELYAVMDTYGEDIEKFFGALEEKLGAVEKSKGKRLRDLEEQRYRLEKDLQAKIEAMVTLQQKFDALARMNGSAAVADSLAERDALHMRSLQQRLEQLVAVHRQLLRKFASLELETVELKKKTQLRDERIRQLEGNSRGLISNIRQQAERHVGELTHLREQMQIMKQEHEYRLEQQRQQDAQQGPGSGTIGLRTVGGGGRPVHQPKSLRGGGGGNRSFSYNDGATSRSTDDHAYDEGIAPLQSSSSISFKSGGNNNNNAYGSNAGSNANNNTTSGNAVRGGAPEAIAIVHAEAVSDEEEANVPILQPAPTPTNKSAKSSVFSRMLKGQK